MSFYVGAYNGTHKLLVHCDITILHENINIINKNKEALLEACRKAGLEVQIQIKLCVCFCLTIGM